MPIDSPELCKFNILMNRPLIGHKCNNFWEISVSSSLSLEWCVVLSYLKSTAKIDKQFSSRLKNLTISQISKKAVKKSINKYNPFLNSSSCFFDDTLKKVVAEFEEKLNQACKKEADEKKRKIALISELLECCICVFDCNRNKTCDVSSLEGKEYMLRIYLIREEADGLEQFKFLLEENNCFQLQKRAFRCILDRTDLTDTHKRNLQKMVSKHKQSRNLLHLLFICNLCNLIPDIYKYPFIANQLASAGFGTDPRVLDKRGTSSFYHVLRHKRIDLIVILYLFAANDCHTSRGTYRNPDSKIILNFYNMNNIIKNDYSELSGEQGCLISEGLLHFNKFLTEINKRLFKLKNELNFSEDITDEQFYAQKRLNKILSILQEYDNFFWIEYSEKICNGSCCKKKNFMENEFFYNIIDFSAALFFFDNVFNLKRTLIRYFHTHCLKLEANFFFLLLSYKYFSRKIPIKSEKYDEFVISPFPSVSECIGRSENAQHFCSFVIFERFQLLNSLRKFSEELETELKEKNIIPKDVVQRLPQDWRVIKDEFILSRLKFYTNAVVEVTNLKSVLSTERALQVLGESLIFDKQDKDSISHLLQDCLPSEIVKILQDLRNLLTHLTLTKFSDKFEAEKNTPFFTFIQAELKEIMNSFKAVFDIQKMKLAHFLTERWKNYLKESEDMHDEKFEGEYKMSIPELKKILDEELTFINNSKMNLKKYSSSNEANLKCEKIKYFKSILSVTDVKSDCHEAEKNIHEKKDSKNTLKLPVIAENTSGVNNITNLVNRIELMETFILEDRHCKELWEKSKSPQARDHLASKIAHRYMVDYEFQASIEMLLLDCYTIMLECCENKKTKSQKKKKKKLDFPRALHNLLVKRRKLCSGISLRNVLAHGDTILEAVADFLDPDDIATELAGKLLVLLRDKEIFTSMLRLWESVIYDHQQFMELIRNEISVDCSEEQKKMISTIKQCPNWEDYYSILICKN